MNKTLSATFWLLAGAFMGFVGYEFLQKSYQETPVSLPPSPAPTASIAAPVFDNDPHNWRDVLGLEYVEGEWMSARNGPASTDAGPNDEGATVLIEPAPTKNKKKRWGISAVLPKQDTEVPSMKCVAEDGSTGQFPASCGPQTTITLRLRQSPDNRLYLENYDLILRHR